MAEEKKKIDVTFITSIATAIRDMDNVVRHVQIVVVQENESKEFRFYCDVVDPSKIKLKEDELSVSDKA